MLSCINIKITFENKSVIFCPHCFSKSIYKYGKDRHGNQKYLCRDCYHQFVTVKKQFNKQNSGYPVCPICGRKTFLWHRYPHYIHFRCVSKKKHHSIKVPIAAPLLKKKSFSKFSAACFKRFRFSSQIILLALILLCYQPIWLLFFLSINREMKVTVGTINKYDTAPLIVLISIQAHLLLSKTRKIYVR